MTNKQAGWIFVALGALLMCNGDLRCALRKTLNI